MATMITSECINCGACEPECPNNAITQGEDIYVIDPLLCTECVGFHDYEACAAVCPVDCCVTDPNNVETEEALIARARSIHPDQNFGDGYQSRFRKGEGQPTPPPASTKKAEQAEATPAAEAPVKAEVPQTPPKAEAPPQPAAMSDDQEPDLTLVELPESEEWEIPVRCFKCNESYVAPVRHFMIGNVLFCPHCHKSMVVKDNLNFKIRTALRDFCEKWEKDIAEFRQRREKELAEFKEKRDKEARVFEARQKRECEKIKLQLQDISQSYDAPGKPAQKRSLLGWG